MNTGESAEEIVCRFREDSMLHRLHLKAQEVSAAALKAVDRAMEAVSARGPDPDYEDDQDIRRLASIIERLAQRPSGNHYSNGNGMSKGIASALWTLVVTGIIGVIVMYGRLAAIEANQVNQQRQLDAQGAKIETLVRRTP